MEEEPMEEETFPMHPPRTAHTYFDEEMIIALRMSLTGMSQQEVIYGDDMPGMTLDEFQAWSDEVIREVTSPGPDMDTAQRTE